MSKINLFSNIIIWRNLHLGCRKQCLSNESVQLAYKVHNVAGETNDKAPIIILHGALGSKTNWNSLARALNKNCLRKVIAVDARGHGDSPHHPILDYHVMSDDILNFLHVQGIAKAVLIGHSMGGRSAMAAALKKPEVIERLVVVDVSPIDNKDPHVLPLALTALLELKFNDQLPLPRARQEADVYLSKSIEDKSLRQFLLTNLVADDSKSGSVRWQCDLSAMANNFSSIRGFPLQSFENRTYDKPTLFIGGGKSNYLRIEDHPTIRKYFTKSEFQYVPGAGHWVHAEKPNEFLEATTAFIK